MRLLGLLLRMRLRIALRTLGPRSGSGDGFTLSLVVVGALGLAFATGVFVGTMVLVRHSPSTVLTMGVLTLWVGIGLVLSVVNTFTQALSSADVIGEEPEWLAVLPLSPVPVRLAGVAAMAAAVVVIPLFFVGPALVGLLVARFSLAGLLGLPVAALAPLLVPVLAVAPLVRLLVRFVPRRARREHGRIVAAALGLVVALGSQLLTRMLPQHVPGRGRPGIPPQLLSLVHLPLAWPVRAVGQGSLAATLWLLLALVASISLAAAVALPAVEREEAAPARRARAKGRALRTPPLTMALLRREAVELARNPMRWLQGMGSGAWIVLVVLTRPHTGGESGVPPIWMVVTASMAMAAWGLSMTSVGVEGQAFLGLRTLPLPGRAVMGAKLLAALALPVAVGAVLLAVLHGGAPPWAAPLFTFGVLGAAAIGTGVSVRFANFRPNRPGSYLRPLGAIPGLVGLGLLGGAAVAAGLAAHHVGSAWASAGMWTLALVMAVCVWGPGTAWLGREWDRLEP